MSNLIQKLFSRKFLTWLIPVILGFVLVLLHYLPANDWWMFSISIASAYFSINMSNKSSKEPKV